jgi:hypothetical protein
MSDKAFNIPGIGGKGTPLSAALAGTPNIIGILSSLGLDVILPGVLQAFAAKLKNKDANNTGPDDIAGNAIAALAPLAPAIVHGDVRTQRQVATAARDALNSYIDSLGTAS